MACTIDIYCDGFIPTARVDNPLPVTTPPDTTYYHAFAGDNRGFKKGGHARVWNWVSVDVQTGSIVARSHGVGISTGYRYMTVKVLDVAWYDIFTPAYRLVEVSDSAMASSDKLKEEIISSGVCNIVVKLVGAASDPLITLSPDMHYEYQVALRGQPSSIQYKLTGSHKGYPAHSVYIGNNLIYGYDPRTVGASPWALMRGDTVQVQRSGEVPANCACGASAALVPTSETTDGNTTDLSHTDGH